MTNHTSTNRVFIATAISLVLGSFLVILGRGSRLSQDPAQQKPGIDDAIALREAARRGGLRELAKLKGNYVAEYNPHWDCWGQFSFETLNKNSAAVIVGRFTKKLDPRLLDGRVIYTDYEFAVDELVKGDIKAQTIVVTLPGGRIFFEDGTSAEQTTPSFEHPLIGRAYTLFLMREAAVPSVFFLSGGPQGMFDIEDSAGVRSRGLPEQPTVVETKGKNRESFLKDVRELARKWPNPGKCC